ncbi:baseplate assembly protein W [Campylobacter jejuni subsp. doylei]|uniref:Baseplate assembly protein W n=1 Tax=Campylobacter jejuni subsp. doylei TaxID=32021 RepID=A0A448JDY4_CAMJU|nr:baseplate assembly protein W [Campylobacter jejuni subsp. doylei]
MISIEESIKDILITPLGSRVMRPDYGSLLYTLIDRKLMMILKSNLLDTQQRLFQSGEKRVKLKGVRLNECKLIQLSIGLLFEDYKDLNMELQI